MAFIDQHLVGTNPDFIQTVKIAILKTATSIAGEDTTSMQPIVATKRHALTQQVFQSPEVQAAKFALHLASLGTIDVTALPDGTLTYNGGSTLDNDVEFSVVSVWDDRAGVTYGDLNP